MGGQALAHIYLQEQIFKKGREENVRPISILLHIYFFIYESCCIHYESIRLLIYISLYYILNIGIVQAFY